MAKKISLKRFCAAPGAVSSCGKYRTALLKPWVHDGFLYATDGRILVREPTRRPNTRKKAKDRYPNEASLFCGFPDCKKRWPQEGKTTTTVHCPNCGPVMGHASVRVGGRKIQGQYVVAILGLGDVYYSPRGKRDSPLAFICGEVQGLVMPLATGAAEATEGE